MSEPGPAGETVDPDFAGLFALLQRYFRRVPAIDGVDTRDLVQETCLRVIRRLQRPPPVVYTDAFALGVGRKVWLEIYRRRNGSEARRARDVLLDVLLSEEPKFPRTPEELRRRARSFLDDYTRLEGDEKEFLIDIGVEGWTVQQAGARRGLSPRRAKSMMEGIRRKSLKDPRLSELFRSLFLT